MFGCPRRSCPCNRCQTLCLGSVVTRKAGPGSTPVGSFPGGQLCGSRAVAKRMFFLNFSRQKCSNLMQFAIESSGCTSSWQRTFDRPHVRSEDRGWWWTLALGLRLESFSALHEGLKSIEASLFAGQTWGQSRTVFMQRTVLGMARHFKRQWHYKNWASVSEISWQEPAASACSGSSGFHFLVQQDCWVWNQLHWNLPRPAQKTSGLRYSHDTNPELTVSWLQWADAGTLQDFRQLSTRKNDEKVESPTQGN